MNTRTIYVDTGIGRAVAVEVPNASALIRRLFRAYGLDASTNEIQTKLMRLGVNVSDSLINSIRKKLKASRKSN